MSGAARQAIATIQPYGSGLNEIRFDVRDPAKTPGRAQLHVSRVAYGAAGDYAKAHLAGRCAVI